MTGPLQHSRVRLETHNPFMKNTLVECRCGWWKISATRKSAQELYSEHKKEAQSKLFTGHQK